MLQTFYKDRYARPHPKKWLVSSSQEYIVCLRYNVDVALAITRFADSQVSFPTL
tara:strand:- start:267 stop:428 length:162 start_codon:yes stop_codon:yes gene_type:complete